MLNLLVIPTTLSEKGQKSPTSTRKGETPSGNPVKPKHRGTGMEKTEGGKPPLFYDKLNSPYYRI